MQTDLFSYLLACAKLGTLDASVTAGWLCGNALQQSGSLHLERRTPRHRSQNHGYDHVRLVANTAKLGTSDVGNDAPTRDLRRIRRAGEIGRSMRPTVLRRDWALEALQLVLVIRTHKSPGPMGQGLLYMVAGTGFEPVTFRL